jgi:hypothetical protein
MATAAIFVGGGGHVQPIKDVGEGERAPRVSYAQGGPLTGRRMWNASDGVGVPRWYVDRWGSERQIQQGANGWRGGY